MNYSNHLNLKIVNFWLLFFQCIIGGYFIFAAINKSRAFYHIEKIFLLIGIPYRAIDPLIWGIIFLELLLGVLLIFNLKNIFIVYSAIISLVFFSFFLTYLLFLPEPPYCGCMGNMRIFQNPFFENLFGLFRNFFFIGILFLRRRMLIFHTESDEK